jgi:hypothetical protein
MWIYTLLDRRENGLDNGSFPDGLTPLQKASLAVSQGHGKACSAAALHRCCGA